MTFLYNRNALSSITRHLQSLPLHLEMRRKIRLVTWTNGCVIEPFYFIIVSPFFYYPYMFINIIVYVMRERERKKVGRVGVARGRRMRRTLPGGRGKLEVRLVPSAFSRFGDLRTFAVRTWHTRTRCVLRKRNRGPAATISPRPRPDYRT